MARTINEPHRFSVPKGYEKLFESASEGRFWLKKKSQPEAQRTLYLATEEGEILESFPATKAKPFQCGIAWILMVDTDTTLPTGHFTSTQWTWKLVTPAGQTVEPEKKIRFVNNFCEDLAWVKTEAQQNFSLIGKSGRVVLKEEFFLVTNFCNGFAWVKIAPLDEEVHLINKKGEKILKFKEENTEFMEWVTNVSRGGTRKFRLKIDGTFQEFTTQKLIQLAQKLNPNISGEIDMEPYTTATGVRRWLNELFQGLGSLDFF